MRSPKKKKILLGRFPNLPPPPRYHPLADKDTFVPLDSPAGRLFEGMQRKRDGSGYKFEVLEDVGHCPHDDRPELVHQHLLPWLDELHASSGSETCAEVA